ncbi:MAG: tyrosine-type recombinase/integrase [Gloeomargaritaceae cyanobacterium C42_A2020_066]|nr:tyrosine-type recombinase/integrase [Gloeomargaritaceae cyanobacterium C42_A2020_066]
MAVKASVYSQDGMLRLNFRAGGQRRRWTLGLPDTPAGQAKAQEIASRVTLDLMTGAYVDDPDHYRPAVVTNEPDDRDRFVTTLGLWQEFTESRRVGGTGGVSITGRYRPMESNLKRFGRNIVDEATAREFIELLRSRQATRSANDNLVLLRGFGKWCVDGGQWTANHFERIKPLKGAKPRRDAFTAQEVRQFLSCIKTDRHYWYYHDLCFTLFHLGLRPSEAFGLKWKHLDLERGTVTICESLSRGEDGRSSGRARQHRSTKTGQMRILRLSAPLLSMFEGRRPPDFSPEGLVFTTPRGLPVDDHSFSQRCWRSICQRAGIPYKPPYCARHTAISHLIESTGSLAAGARLAGHVSVEMVGRVYAHLIEEMTLPDYGHGA